MNFETAAPKGQPMGIRVVCVALSELETCSGPTQEVALGCNGSGRGPAATELGSHFHLRNS